MFVTEHTFPQNADGTLQEGQYFGSHPRNPLAPRAHRRGASGPASEPRIQPLAEDTGGASAARSVGRVSERPTLYERSPAPPPDQSIQPPFGEAGVSEGGSGLAGAARSQSLGLRLRKQHLERNVASL
jgi:hypothetical protein